MKRQFALLALAVATAAPAVVAPRLSAVKAQDAANPAPAEYPDVPRGHWAYEAINKLSQAGIVEGLPSGNYVGNKPMTRYEFAVAIARLLDRMGGAATPGPQGEVGPQGPQGPAGAVGPAGPGSVDPITRAEVNDLIAALRREFADELARLGVRVGDLENRVTALENRVTAPPRVTITPSILHRTGTATYISQVAVPAQVNAGGVTYGPAGPGRSVVNGNGFAGVGAVLPRPPYTAFPRQRERIANEKYSYTEFELRLTDRITDRLSVTGALRSLGSTQEDPWAGDVAGFGSTAYMREAYAVADLSDRSFLGIKGLTGILGRQRTKIGQGLLYDNDLQPTDQIQGSFNIGPLSINGFIGTSNNQTLTAAAGNSPYLGSGAVRFLGASGDPARLFNLVNGNVNDANRLNVLRSGAAVGFPNQGAVGNYLDDNEAGARVGFNLFRISGQPVSVGITRLFDGISGQQGDSADITIPLFNRTIGFEYVRQRQYAFGGNTSGNPSAYNLTVPLFRSRLLDASFAYGKADNDFEYFVASSANPYARTYAEALFDRPMALGAPMINGRPFNYGNGQAGTPFYAAAKEVYDFTGTLRLIRRLPLDFRFYRGYGSAIGNGGQRNKLDLGTVFTVGSTFNISPGLDLELKYGQYNVYGTQPNIKYVRVGANVGF